MERVIDQSYWVVPDLFLSGGYLRSGNFDSSRRSLQSLLDAGFTRFIDLTTLDDNLPLYDSLLQELSGGEAQRCSFPLQEHAIPESHESVISILDAVDSALCAGHRVYLHSKSGIGRAPLVVGCWLQRHFEGKIISSMVPRRLQDLWGNSSTQQSVSHPPDILKQREYVEGWSETNRLLRNKKNSTPWTYPLSTRAKEVNTAAYVFNRELHDSAARGDWMGVVRGLSHFQEQVNHSCYEGKICFSPLHHAAEQGVSREIVEKLLQFGAFRTLRSCDGETPQEIARRKGHLHLVDLLEPKPLHSILSDELSVMTRHFCDFLKTWIVEGLMEEEQLRLHPLEPLTELEAPLLSFTIPGFYDALKVELRRASSLPQLMIFCSHRIVSQKVSITALLMPQGAVVLERGTVLGFKESD